MDRSTNPLVDVRVPEAPTPRWLRSIGRAVSIGGISIYRITDGKMPQVWIEYDMLGLLQQLGVVPSMG
jgi:hypothetical protein